MSMCAKVSDVNLNDRHTSNALSFVHFISIYHLYMYLHSWKGGMSKLSKYMLKKKMAGPGMKPRSPAVLVKCSSIQLSRPISIYLTSCTCTSNKF